MPSLNKEGSIITNLKDIKAIDNKIPKTIILSLNS